MSQREKELWDEFRANSAEMLLDTIFLAICVACIAALQFEAHRLLGPEFEVVKGYVTLEFFFNTGHALALARWIYNGTIRALRVRVRSR